MSRVGPSEAPTSQVGDRVSLLTGQAAVVTGGAQGLGFAIAERFVSEGARVVLGDLHLDATEAAAERLGGAKVATAVRCDVTRADEVEALVAAAVERFGGLDVMVNNAGITRDATLRKMTEEQFDQVIAVHLKGTWNGLKSAAAIMRESRRGAIVNMSSISGKVGLVGQTNYSAAKAGIVGMTKAAAKELAHLGVRVNAIQPGLIRSAMTEAMPQHIWDQKLAEVPMGRAGDPSEVAKVALFLASNLSSYMTGTVLEVTGGRHI
ncbi:3-oxoacyl-ACP reductase FabG [Mycolicibacterium doricum]|uniref:Beta-ketoacyl-ACP reductase n=1 Tax=Mycolicibacterium doricum TaxID=126673 RepID=A0A1X1TG32_9MYCO|nr:3-oxoacyl-ACP reductase FabG [Mycolicibacterium doricum]MCV7266840.1 3-oxoacyl-ACP reductase FabG [Mycolicibacterium doricum]ORV43507.1 beta-ketoacyl-ACP reductase [Mycolicibacterium doricum]